MEYYDYGLALLSYELCWTPYQMANLEVNVARQTHAELKEYHEEIVRLINYPEFMLYEYFNTTFWEKGMDSFLTFYTSEIRADPLKHSKFFPPQEVSCLVSNLFRLHENNEEISKFH